MRRLAPDLEALLDVSITRWGGGDWVRERTMTVGRSRAILAAASADLSGVSRLNKGLSRQQAWEILSAALAGMADDTPVQFLLARNILREFPRQARVVGKNTVRP